MSNNWYYKLGGEEFGPIDKDALQELLRRGEVGLRTPVRSKKSQEWIALGQTGEFAPVADEEPAVEIGPASSLDYAPLWRRAIALGVDSLALGVGGILFANILAVVLVARRISPEAENLGADLWLVPYVVLALPWVYFSLFEGSSLQATPGKLLMRVFVTDISGYAPGYRRAATRAAVKYVSSILLMAGFAMPPFSSRRQTLHDFVAGTVVLGG